MLYNVFLFNVKLILKVKSIVTLSVESFRFTNRNLLLSLYH